MIKYSDKNGQCRGCVDGGFIDIWLKDIPKREFCAHTSIVQIDSMLSQYGNSHWCIHEIARQIIFDANVQWIENTKDDALKAERRKRWECDSIYSYYAPLQEIQDDSCARVIWNLYTMCTGDEPRSWFERCTKKIPMIARHHHGDSEQ